MILLPVRYSLERLKPFQASVRNPRDIQELRSLEGRFGSKRVALFNCPYPIEAMFYTPYTAYPFFPTDEQRKRVIEQGYEVAFF